MAAEGAAETARGQGFSFGAVLRRRSPTMISLPSVLPKPAPPVWCGFGVLKQPEKQQEVAQAAKEACSAAQSLDQVVQLPGGELKPLKSLCSQATCGLDGQNLVSKTHRQALKLDAVHFSTSFRLEETTILAEVQQSAQPQPGHVTAQLQAVNVYGLGDFFKEHKDSAIADDSFGTLVVGLPSSYTGGQLHVWNERGKMAVNHDWSSILSSDPQCINIAWAFVALGCFHEVQEVTAGHRLTLVYSLHGSNAHNIVKDFNNRQGLCDAAYGPGWERRGGHTTKHDVQFLPNAWQSVKKQTDEGHQQFKPARSVLRMLACWSGSQ